MSCLTRSKFPLLKRLSDRGWISCMFVNIICSPFHPRGTRRSLKVSHSNANICLALEPEWDRLGHLHQRYSLVDRSHKVESGRWNNGWSERGSSMQIPHRTHPCVKQSILINISCNENVLIRKKVETFSAFPRGSPAPLFSPALILVCVMSFSGRPSWKNGDKTSCNNGPQRPSLSSFFLCLELMIVWAKEGQMCWKSKSIESHKQFGMAAHTYPHSQTFFYVRFTWHRARPPPPGPLNW